MLAVIFNFQIACFLSISVHASYTFGLDPKNGPDNSKRLAIESEHVSLNKILDVDFF